MTTNWRLGLGFSLVTVLMWGVLPLALKEVLAAMDPLTITWYRFSLSAILALLWYGRKRRRQLQALLFNPQWPLTFAAVMGLLANYLLYIWGLDHINPGASQILIQLAPLLLLVGSVIIFKERFSRVQWLGVASLCVGMLLFFHHRFSSGVAVESGYLIGVALIIGAALTWALYGLAQKQLLVEHDARDILFLICLTGTLLLWPLAEPQQIGALTTRQVAMLVFLGVNTIVAYGCFGLAMSYWQASRVSAIMPIAPLLTLLFIYLLNDLGLADIASEPLDSLSITGAVMVVGGAAVSALSANKEPA